MVEEDIDPFRLVAVPRHFSRQTIGRGWAGSNDIGVLNSTSENHVGAGCPCLGEQSSIESPIFGAPPNEPSVWLTASNHARDAPVIVKRRPVGRAKVEVSSDADPVEECRNRFAFRSRLHDLQIADETRPDVALRLVDLHRPPAPGERDCCGETGRSCACDANWAVILHQSGYVIAPVPGCWVARLLSCCLGFTSET